jgi:thymidylate kinase
MPRLLVLAGPIGSGKSTVADLSATRLAEGDLATVVVDLDDAAFAQRGVTDLEDMWRRAALATAAQVRGWFEAGTDVVIAHGPFFESGGYEILIDGLTDEVSVTHVLLHVSLASAGERIADDPDRVWSKDPVFLRATHERFADLRHTLPRVDLEIDTETCSADEIAEQIVVVLRSSEP